MIHEMISGHRDVCVCVSRKPHDRRSASCRRVATQRERERASDAAQPPRREPRAPAPGPAAPALSSRPPSRPPSHPPRAAPSRAPLDQSPARAPTASRLRLARTGMCTAPAQASRSCRPARRQRVVRCRAAAAPCPAALAGLAVSLVSRRPPLPSRPPLPPPPSVFSQDDAPPAATAAAAASGPYRPCRSPATCPPAAREPGDAGASERVRGADLDRRIRARVVVRKKGLPERALAPAAHPPVPRSSADRATLRRHTEIARANLRVPVLPVERVPSTRAPALSSRRDVADTTPTRTRTSTPTPPPHRFDTPDTHTSRRHGLLLSALR